MNSNQLELEIPAKGGKMRRRKRGRLDAFRNYKYKDRAYVWLKMYEAGSTLRRIAAEVGVSHFTVRYALNKIGCRFRPGPGLGKKNTLWRGVDNSDVAANRYVFRALRAGVVARPVVCDTCKTSGTRIVAHHADYNYYLDILWLCDVCHRAWHRAMRPTPRTRPRPRRGKRSTWGDEIKPGVA